jgi:hypothetical protein
VVLLLAFSMPPTAVDLHSLNLGKENVMFGHHGLLERQLRKNGKTAIATVLECRQTSWSETRGNPGLVGNTKVECKLKLRVEPDGESPFEAATDALFGQFSIPTEGMPLRVLYDPSNHKKVAIDHSEAAEEATATAMIDQRMQPVIDRARGNGTEAGAATADGLQQVLASGMLTKFSRDPAKRAEQRQQIKQIMAGAQAAHGVRPTNLIVGGQPVYGGQAGGAPSAADQLTKLADLRDRGVLSDAEFEQQKQKLLGE